MSKQIKIVHVSDDNCDVSLNVGSINGVQEGTNFWYILFPTTRSWIRIPGNP